MRNAGEHIGQRADNAREDASTAGPAAYRPGEPAAYAAGQTAAGTAGEAAGEMWAAGFPADYPAGARRTDTWVLVCGGIAAAAAFAAAFVAAGGVAGAGGQHALPGSTVPAVVSQACPSAAP